MRDTYVTDANVLAHIRADIAGLIYMTSFAGFCFADNSVILKCGTAAVRTCEVDVPAQVMG
jgi:hypothetical protein